uniref:BZIP domain-containing protein n=1 Tax=Parascaris equorum TaxID=6256 RepID=A0A914RAZ1_PAREQ
MKGPVDGVHAASDEGLVINPYSRIEDTIEKKRRNLEKRKIRLQQYEEDLRNGKKLSEEQQEARSRIGEVETQLEFMKDLMKMLTGLQKEYHRSAKQRDEANRKRQMEMERGRLAEFIYYQNIFRILSKEHVAGALVDASEGAPVSCIFALYASKGWLYALTDHFLIKMPQLVVEGR